MEFSSYQALVVLSGGQDSATVSAFVNALHGDIHALTFNYGQRHQIEVESACKVAALYKALSHEILVLPDSTLRSTSPLVSQNQLGTYDSVENLPGGVEPTFVPGRNLLFLVLAANRAMALGVRDIYIGVCEADYGGYWDCRQSFITSTVETLGLGLAGDSEHFRIHTPLMHKTKAESVKLAQRFLGDDFERVMNETHTCYAGVKGGCGRCHACLIRDRGFREAGIPDPLWQLRNPAVVQ